MHGVDKAIYDLLSEDTRIQAIMGVSSKDKVNVYPYNPDQQVTVPSVTYYESDREQYLNFPNTETLTYYIDIWTSGLDDSTRLAQAVDEILSVRNTVNEYARVCQFTKFTSGEQLDPSSGKYHKTLVYKVIAINKQV